MEGFELISVVSYAAVSSEEMAVRLTMGWVLGLIGLIFLGTALYRSKGSEKIPYAMLTVMVATILGIALLKREEPPMRVEATMRAPSGEILKLKGLLPNKQEKQP